MAGYFQTIHVHYQDREHKNLWCALDNLYTIQSSPMFISNYSQFRESTRDDASKAQLRPISLSFIHAIIDSLKYEKRANIYWKDSPWKNGNPHMIHQKQKKWAIFKQGCGCSPRSALEIRWLFFHHHQELKPSKPISQSFLRFLKNVNEKLSKRKALKHPTIHKRDFCSRKKIPRNLKLLT